MRIIKLRVFQNKSKLVITLRIMKLLKGRGEESVKAEKPKIFCDLGLHTLHCSPSRRDNTKCSKDEM